MPTTMAEIEGLRQKIAALREKIAQVRAMKAGVATMNNIIGMANEDRDKDIQSLLQPAHAPGAIPQGMERPRPNPLARYALNPGGAVIDGLMKTLFTGDEPLTPEDFDNPTVVPRNNLVPASTTDVMAQKPIERNPRRDVLSASPMSDELDAVQTRGELRPPDRQFPASSTDVPYVGQKILRPSDVEGSLTVGSGSLDRNPILDPVKRRVLDAAFGAADAATSILTDPFGATGYRPFSIEEKRRVYHDLYRSEEPTGIEEATAFGAGMVVPALGTIKAMKAFGPVVSKLGEAVVGKTLSKIPASVVNGAISGGAVGTIYSWLSSGTKMTPEQALEQAIIMSAIGAAGGGVAGAMAKPPRPLAQEPLQPVSQVKPTSEPPIPRGVPKSGMEVEAQMAEAARLADESTARLDRIDQSQQAVPAKVQAQTDQVTKANAAKVVPERPIATEPSPPISSTAPAVEKPPTPPAVEGAGKVLSNQEKLDAIRRHLASGKPVYVRTSLGATRLTSPDQINISSKGELWFPRGKQKTWLLQSQVDDIAAQSGVKLPPSPFDDLPPIDYTKPPQGESTGQHFLFLERDGKRVPVAGPYESAAALDADMPRLNKALSDRDAFTDFDSRVRGVVNDPETASQYATRIAERFPEGAPQKPPSQPLADAGGVSPVRAKTPESVPVSEPIKTPKPPAPPVETPKPTAEAPKPPRQVSLRKAEGAQIRKRLDLDALDEPRRQSFEEAWDKAAESGLADDAVNIAKSAVEQRRPLNAEEHAAAVQKYIQLSDDLKTSRGALESAAKSGNDAAVVSEMTRSMDILDQIDALTRATDAAGTEAGRALSVRRLRGNAETFELGTVLQAARAKKGRALTPDEITKYEEPINRLKELEKQNETLRVENQKLADAKKKRVAETVTEVERHKAISNRIAVKKEQILKQRSEIEKQLADLGYRLNDVTGVTAEGSYLIGRLAVSYIQEAVAAGKGKIQLDAVVNQVLERFNKDQKNPQLTARDVYEALNARDPKVQAKARGKAQSQVIELKKQAQLLIDLEKAEKGIFEPKKTVAPTSAEVSAIRAKIKELRSAATRYGKTPEAKKAALDELARLEDQLNRGYRPFRPKTELPPDVAQIRERINAVRQQLNVQDRVAALESAIEKAERGEFPPVRHIQTSVEVRALQKKLTQLRNQAYKSGMAPERLERAVSQINQLQDQLTNHYRNLRKPKPEVTPELAEMQKKMVELRREMRAEDTLADLQEQLRTGEFKVNQRESPFVSPELERNQILIRNARRQIVQRLEAEAPVGVRKAVGETTSFLRAIKATADLSASLRQGLVLSARRPMQFAKAQAQALKATFSSYKADQIANAIANDPRMVDFDQMGVKFADLGESIGKREEFFMSRLAERIPGIGEVVKASERHMTTFLNLMRKSAADQFLDAFPNATLAEKKAFGQWINVATGRGDLGRLSPIATELSTVVFAPRFAASRIQTPFMLFKNWKNPRVRAEIAKDYAAVAGLGATVLTLAELSGMEVGSDPRSSDWGKIRSGDTRIDIWAGMQQPMRVVARLGLGATDRAGLTGKDLKENEKDVDPLELLGRFAAYKLAPSVTIPLEFYKGKTMVGEETTPSETAVRAIVPLLYSDIIDAWKGEGAKKAAVVGGLGLVGVGASSYPDSEAATRIKARRLKAEGKTREASDLLVEWNKKNPKNRITNP